MQTVEMDRIVHTLLCRVRNQLAEKLKRHLNEVGRFDPDLMLEEGKELNNLISKN